MGSSDVPPPTAPAWLIPASTACLGLGVAFWLAAYVLMARRSLATGYTPMPLPALGVNLAWEVVWAAYVSDTMLERVGFGLWLVFDVPVLAATLRTARRSLASHPLMAGRAAGVLAVAFAWGLAASASFASWWLREPHRGHGVKWGKTWNGLEARDTTELSWWAAGAAQMVFSVGALGMLVQRGHSGGQSHAIWFCRFVGSQMGLPVACGLLWWYWPEPHGFILHPLSFIMVGTSMVCDVAYPFVLAHVKRTESVLADGRIVPGPAGARAKDE